MKIDPKNFYAYKMELFKKIAGLKILLSIPKTLTDLRKKKKKKKSCESKHFLTGTANL